MFYKFVLLSILLLNVINSDQYFLILAGSNGFQNYRHQADTAHAYKYLLDRKVNPNNIILMMYDDVARDTQNSAYRYLRNRPNGENVYDSIEVDYRGSDVTPKNFLAILNNDLSVLRFLGSGRLLNPKANDTVVIYMTDHGGVGIFGFPSDVLAAPEFNKAIQNLKKRCSKVLIMLEACESGSMFENYLKSSDDGILAVTASDGRHSSYAMYYDKKLKIYLGDEFSTGFLETMDRIDTTSRTVKHLYEMVSIITTHSSPQYFGDKRLFDDKLDIFFPHQMESNYFNKFEKEPSDSVLSERIPSDDVQEKIALRKLEIDINNKEAQNVIKNMLKIEETFKKITGTSIKRVNKSAIELKLSAIEKENVCYFESVKLLVSNCKDILSMDTTFKHMKLLLVPCADNGTLLEVVERIQHVCNDFELLPIY